MSDPKEPTTEEVKVVTEAATELAAAAVEQGLVPMILANGFTEEQAEGLIVGLEIGVAIGQMHRIWTFWFQETMELWHESHGDDMNNQPDLPAIASDLITAMMAASRKTKQSDAQKQALGIALARLVPMKARSDA
jgi:hypothetical protein